jgi:hypothetical protein
MRRIVGYAKISAILSLLLGVLAYCAPVAAQDALLDVQVCGPLAISSLQITEPESDVVFRESPITLEGETELINQVEIYIDGGYSKIIAIPRGSTKFITSVSLPAGTHTIEVRGIGICDGDERFDEVVVTYDPPEEVTPPNTPPGRPSKGSNTPTVVNPNPTPQQGGGVVVSNPNPSTDDDKDASGRDGGLVGDLWRKIGGDKIGEWFVRMTDLDVTTERLAAEWVKVLSLAVGTAIIIGAGIGIGPIAELRRSYRIAFIVAGLLMVLASVLIFL